MDIDFKKLFDKAYEMDLDNIKYKCWDCEKEIKDVQFDMETKKRLPKSSDGFILLICKDCKDNDY